MSLPTPEALKLFQVADAVLHLSPHTSVLIQQADAFATPVFSTDEMPALQALLALSEAQRLELREERLREVAHRYAPSHAERQAKAFIEEWISCPR
jgi:hypothetical protein